MNIYLSAYLLVCVPTDLPVYQICLFISVSFRFYLLIFHLFLSDHFDASFTANYEHLLVYTHTGVHTPKYLPVRQVTCSFNFSEFSLLSVNFSSFSIGSLFFMLPLLLTMNTYLHTRILVYIPRNIYLFASYLFI